MCPRRCSQSSGDVRPHQNGSRVCHSWTSIEQEIYVTPWLAQPGAENLSAGRHWHFFSVLFWIANGLVYVLGLFASGEWDRLVPTSWSIFPDAWQDLVTYATFQTPPLAEFHPFDPLQQLTYFSVVFILAPLLIVTGLAQAPAIEASQPWLPALFGGRQGARSIHFLGMCAFVAFILLHLAMVMHTRFGRNLSEMIFGTPTGRCSASMWPGITLVSLPVCSATNWAAVDAGGCFRRSAIPWSGRSACS